MTLRHCGSHNSKESDTVGLLGVARATWHLHLEIIIHIVVAVHVRGIRRDWGRGRLAVHHMSEADKETEMHGQDHKEGK